MWCFSPASASKKKSYSHECGQKNIQFCSHQHWCTAHIRIGTTMHIQFSTIWSKPMPGSSIRQCSSHSKSQVFPRVVDDVKGHQILQDISCHRFKFRVIRSTQFHSASTTIPLPNAPAQATHVHNCHKLTTYHSTRPSYRHEHTACHHLQESHAPSLDKGPVCRCQALPTPSAQDPAPEDHYKKLQGVWGIMAW